MTLWTLTRVIVPTSALCLVSLLAWLLTPTYAQSASTQDLSQQPPAPPSTPPLNDTRPGGGLAPDEISCGELENGLQALIPVENPVLTTTPYPTFLFYVPAGAEAVPHGEFSVLLWPGEEVRHYRTRFTLPESPGVVSITIPELPAHALAEDQIYRWYFHLYCGEDTNAQPDFTLRGAVQRVALTPERSQQIQAASPAIWYDAIAHVASRLQASPQDSQLQTTWRELMQSIDAEAAEAAPFAGSVLLIED